MIESKSLNSAWNINNFPVVQLESTYSILLMLKLQLVFCCIIMATLSAKAAVNSRGACGNNTT
jgi:hypothetical protein